MPDITESNEATDMLEAAIRRAEVAEQLAEELASQRDQLQAQVITLTDTLRGQGGPMTEEEITELATFNSERARGVVHTPGYVLQMSALQARYDVEWYGRLVDAGWTETREGSRLWTKSEVPVDENNTL